MSGSAVGKIKASRVNNLDAAEYVGPQGQMWYDVDTGLLRLGDDVTPGGIIVGGGGGNGSPGGPNHSIQFNNAGTFGGASGLTTDGTNITSTGNVRAAYFLGDGSQLTNLPTGNYDNANVQAYLPTYTGILTGLAAVTAVGNISGQYILGNGAFLTGITAGTNYSNANVASYLPTYTGNLTAGNILTNNYLYANGQPFTPGTNYSNANVASYLPTYTGNLAGGNVSVTGFLYGNGAFLTGISAGNYSNANVASYLPTYTGNLTSGNISVIGNVNTNILNANSAVYQSNVAVGGQLSATGNIITTGYFVGNFQGNISGNFTVPGSNTQVLYNLNGNAGASPFFTFDAAADVLSVAGNIRVGNILTDNYLYANGQPFTPGTNYSNANVSSYLPTYTGNLAGGNVSVTGYVYGNGAFLTGISASGSTYSNANVQAYMPTYSGNVGNINTAGYIFGNGYYLAGLPTLNYSNANVANYLPTYTGNLSGGNVSVTGNLTGGNLLAGHLYGNGFYLTGIQAGTNYSNANVASYLPTYSGNLTAGNVLTNNYLYANGTPFVTNNYTNANVAAYLPTYTGNLNTVNIVQASYLAGDGSNISNLPGANVSGTVTAAYYANTAGSTTFANTATTANTASTAGTVTTAAQPNITSVGTLSTLSVTGTINAGNLVGNGSQLTGIPASKTLVTSNITSLISGYALNVESVAGNALYPGGIFNIYQSAAPVPTISVTNNWAGTGTTSKNAYANYAGNVVNTSNVTMTIGLSSGAFSVQSTDNIVIGNSVITGNSLTALNINGTGGTYTIASSLIGNATQIANSTSVSVNLTTNSGGPYRGNGTVLTTIAPVVFSLSNITANFTTTALSPAASNSQPINFTVTTGNGTPLSGNIIISGAANATTSVGSSLTGSTANVNSTAGNFIVKGSYLGTGLYGAGNSIANVQVTLPPATLSTPMFIKTTATEANPNFGPSDTNFGADWVPGPGTPGNTYGFTTNQFNPTTQYYWIALPDSTFWSYGADPNFAGAPPLYYNTAVTGLGIVNLSFNAAYGNGTDTFGGSGGTVTIGGAPYVVLGFTDFANVQNPSNPPNVFVYVSTSSTS